jgi:pyridoxine/pyridoxamine 5'-phosphate oxidase
MSEKKDSNNLFVEQRAGGDFAVRKANSERASAVTSTQAEAISRAKELNPNAAIHVERVRHTNSGTPDKWRKP